MKKDAHDWSKFFRVIDTLKQLTSSEKYLAHTLMAQADGCTGSIRQTYKQLQHKTKLSKTTIQLGATKLVTLNIITKKYSKQDKALHIAPKYTINPLNTWKVKTTIVSIRSTEIAFDKYYRVLYFSPELTLTDKMLITRLMASAGGADLFVRKKQNTLASELGIHQSTVKRSLKKLINLKIITRTHIKTDQAMHRPALFHILPFNSWHVSGYQNMKEVRHENDTPLEKSIYIKSSLQERKDKSFHSFKKNITPCSTSKAVEMNKKFCNKDKLALLKNKEYILALNKLKESFLAKDKKKRPVLKQSLRSKLKGAHKTEKDKFKKSLFVDPSQRSLSVLNKWKRMQEEYPHLYVKHKKSKRNKTYQAIVKSLNALFRGTLFATGKAVLPERMKPFTQKYTLQEVYTFLDRLHVQMSDPHTGIHPFGDTKANLKIFLLGNKNTHRATPSKLLSCCLKEPLSINLKYKAEIIAFQKMYCRSIEINKVFNAYETQALDAFCSWAIPYARSLDRTFAGIGGASTVFRAAIRVIKRIVGNDKVPPLMFGKSFLQDATRKAVKKEGFTL